MKYSAISETGQSDPEQWVHRDVLHRTNHVHEPTVADPIVVVVVSDPAEWFATLPPFLPGRRRSGHENIVRWAGSVTAICGSLVRRVICSSRTSYPRACFGQQRARSRSS